jgi:hypothetical protein
LNEHGDNDVRQTETHTAEPPVPEPSAFKVEMAIEKLKRYKSTGIDQIPAELIKAGGNKICFEIYKLINSVWKKDEMPEQWKESIIVPVLRKVIKQRHITVVNCIQNSIKHPSVNVNTIRRRNWGPTVCVST